MTVVLLLLGTAGAARAEWLTLPISGAGRVTESVLVVDLKNGVVVEAEPRRSGEAFRLQRLETNLFVEIGRSLDEPALPGEVFLSPLRDFGGRTRSLLFLETPTGFGALVTKLRQGARLGELKAVAGRPTAPIASPDANFALMVREVPSRRRLFAYIVHGSTGKCLRLELDADGTAEGAPKDCGLLPRLKLGSGQAGLQYDGGEVSGYLLVDGSDGAVYRVLFSTDRPDAVSVVRSGVNLVEVFGAAEVGPRPFVVIPVHRSGGETSLALALDPVTKRMALLTGLGVGETVTGRLLGPSLGSYLDIENKSPSWQAVPRINSNGETQGIWLFENGTQRIVLIDSPGNPAELSLRRVEILQ
ncbi:MAG TPA: hypothetical protein VF017_20120 [Thermoanaerobaculia bacterium]|nr:hypothetical protein [Thermoanaerobaculia bacterium]